MPVGVPSGMKIDAEYHPCSSGAKTDLPSSGYAYMGVKDVGAVSADWNVTEPQP